MDYLIVDMTRVLRETDHGKAAHSSLEKLVERSQAQEATLREKVEQATGPAAVREAKTEYLEFTQARGKELERRRDALESALVRVANAAVRSIAEERGVELVLERAAVLHCPEGADVTDAVIAKVNSVRLGAREAG